MRPHMTSMRDGVGFWAFSRASGFSFIVAGTAIGLIESFQDGSEAGQWDDSLRTAINRSLFVVFGACAGAALDANRARKRWPSLASSYRGVAPAWLLTLANALLGCLGVLCLCAVALASTAAVSPFRLPHMGLVVVALAWCVMSAAIGWGFGWVLPWFIALPVALLETWLVNAAFAAESGTSLALMSGLENGVFMAGIEPVLPVMTAQVASFTAIAIAVIALTQRRIASTGTRIIHASSAVVLIGIAITLVTTYGPERARTLSEAAGPRTCGSTPIPSCSWPDDDRSRRATALAASRMWTELAAYVPVPAGVSDLGLAHPSSWASLSMWSRDPSDLIEDLAFATLSWYWCPPRQRINSDFAATRQRQLWLASKVAQVVPAALNAETKEVMSQGASRQITWLLEKPTDLACVPTR